MNVDNFYVRLRHKRYHFINTGFRFYDVSSCILDDDGPLMNAVPTPASTVADLVAQEQREKQELKKARRIASRIKELRKEEAV
jgi:hypothetical protein